MDARRGSAVFMIFALIGAQIGFAMAIMTAPAVHLGASFARTAGGAPESMWASWPSGNIEVSIPGRPILVSVTRDGDVTYYPPDGGRPISVGPDGCR